jgi:hypothetical protein
MSLLLLFQGVALDKATALYDPFDGGATVPAAVLADSPLVYYRKGEASGTTMVAEVGDDGTYLGGPLLAQAGATADGDTAVTYDGSDDQGVLPGTLIIPAGSSITVEFWLYVASADAGHNGSAFTIGDQSGERCQVHVWGNGELNWDYGGSGGAGRVTTMYTGHYDAWTHVALTFDAATNEHAIYLDASLAVSATDTTKPTIDLSGGAVGRFLGFYLKGGLDEFAVYDTALTPTRIAAHYDAAATLPGGGSVPDSNIWVSTLANIESNALVINQDSSTISKNAYDLTESFWAVKVTNGMTASWLSSTPVSLTINSVATPGNNLGFSSDATNLLFMKNNASIGSVVYNATSMAWMRVRETSGTSYYETSPDGATWTLQTSTATPTNMNSAKVNMFGGVGAPTSVDQVGFPDVQTFPLTLTATVSASGIVVKRSSTTDMAVAVMVATVPRRTNKVASATKAVAATVTRLMTRTSTTTQGASATAIRRANAVRLAPQSAAASYTLRTNRTLLAAQGTLVTVTTNLRRIITLVATATTIASTTRRTSATQSATEATAASATKVASVTRTATQGNSASILSAKVFLKTLAAIQGTAATVSRSVGALRLAVQNTSITIPRSLSVTRTVTETVNALIIKRTSKTLEPSGGITTTASIQKTAGHIERPTVVTTSTITRRVNKLVTAVQPTLPTVAKLIAKSYTAVQSMVASTQAIRAFLVTLTATQGTAATTTKRVGKVAAATQSATSAVSRRVNAARTAVEPTSATTTRRIAATRSATQANNATITIQNVILRTLTATVGTAASVSRRVGNVRITIVSTLAAATKRAGRTMTTTQGSTASLSKRPLLVKLALQSTAVTVISGAAKTIILVAQVATNATVGRSIRVTRSATANALIAMVRRIDATQEASVTVVPTDIEQRSASYTFLATVGTIATILAQKIDANAVVDYRQHKAAGGLRRTEVHGHNQSNGAAAGKTRSRGRGGLGGSRGSSSTKQKRPVR